MAKKSYNNNSYLKYSGMAMQMGLIIALFSFGGYYLDLQLKTTPIFILIGSLGGVGLALYLFIKQALNDNK